jgi:uncharacterized protein
MSDGLPELIDPLALAEKRRRFSGALALSQLARVADLLDDPAGEARFELSFSKEGRLVAIEGRVEAVLRLRCQCCMQPMAWRVDSPIRLAVVQSLDEADILPEDFEPLLLEEDAMPLADIIQDELLLALPPIPQHEQCDAWAEPAPQAPIMVAPAPRENPFAVLAALKKQN